MALLEQVFGSKAGPFGSDWVQNYVNSASMTMSFEKVDPSKTQSLLFLQIFEKEKHNYIF